MDQAAIENILSNTAGNPVSGVVHDIIPAMAAAIAAAINGQGAKDRGKANEEAKADTRVVKASETR
jgi:hypothetical protein